MAGLLFVPNNITVSASSQEKVSYIEREKIYSDANENNLFSSSSVIVILNRKIHIRLKNIQKKIFLELNVYQLRN